MSQTITLSEPIFALLDQEAKRKHVSPSDLAERLLAESLNAEQRVALLAELYAADADEDHALAESGMAEYSAGLKQEDL